MKIDVTPLTPILHVQVTWKCIAACSTFGCCSKLRQFLVLANRSRWARWVLISEAANWPRCRRWRQSTHRCDYCCRRKYLTMTNWWSTTQYCWIGFLMSYRIFMVLMSKRRYILSSLWQLLWFSTTLWTDDNVLTFSTGKSTAGLNGYFVTKVVELDFFSKKMLGNLQVYPLISVGQHLLKYFVGCNQWKKFSLIFSTIPPNSR